MFKCDNKSTIFRRAFPFILAISLSLIFAACAEKEEDEDDELADVNGPMPAKEVALRVESSKVTITWLVPTKEDSLFNRDIHGFMITRHENESDEALPARTQKYEIGDLIGAQEVMEIIEADPTKDEDIGVTWEDGALKKGVTYRYTIYTYDEVPNYSDPFHLEATPGSLIEPRTNHAQTLLADGRVFLCGGTGYGGELDSAEIFDPDGDSFEMLADTLNRPRTDHTATLLNDGRVLIVGGFDEVDDENEDEDEDEGEDQYVETLSSAEIFDPDTGIFRFLDARMSAGRGKHTATLLPDGRVLVVGGNDGVNAFDSAEIFDPETESFSLVSDTMEKSRYSHTVTPFYLGQEFRLLVAGGSNKQKAIDSATFFNGVSQDFGRFDPVPDNEENSLFQSRMNHGATLTNNDLVILTGGFSGAPTAGRRIAGIEIFDIAGGEFLEGTSLETPRSEHIAALLPDGRVLISGGVGNGSMILSGSEIYDPENDSVSAGSPLIHARSSAKTTVLEDGRIFVSGGNASADPFAPRPVSSAEVFDSGTGDWAVVPAPR